METQLSFLCTRCGPSSPCREALGARLQGTWAQSGPASPLCSFPGDGLPSWISHPNAEHLPETQWLLLLPLCQQVVHLPAPATSHCSSRQ